MPHRLDVLTGAGPALVTGAGGLLLVATAQFDGAAVAFGPGEIALVATLLSAVVAALSLVFKMLLASKQEQVIAADRRSSGLEMLLTQASNRAETQEQRLTDLLTGAVRASEVATVKATEALADIASMVGRQMEQGSKEHREIVEALHQHAGGHGDR